MDHAVSEEKLAGTPAPEGFLSWAPEVIADSSGWAGNALRFATKEESDANVRDLMMRWWSVKETRSVPSKDPVNYSYVDGNLERLEEAHG